MVSNLNLGLLFFVQSASAHGGEDKEGLSNLQIMLISLAACLCNLLNFGKNIYN